MASIQLIGPIFDGLRVGDEATRTLLATYIRSVAMHYDVGLPLITALPRSASMPMAVIEGVTIYESDRFDAARMGIWDWLTYLLTAYTPAVDARVDALTPAANTRVASRRTCDERPAEVLFANLRRRDAATLAMLQSDIAYEASRANVTLPLVRSELSALEPLIVIAGLPIYASDEVDVNQLGFLYWLRYTLSIYGNLRPELTRRASAAPQPAPDVAQSYRGVIYMEDVDRPVQPRAQLAPTAEEFAAAPMTEAEAAAVVLAHLSYTYASRHDPELEEAERVLTAIRDRPAAASRTFEQAWSNALAQHLPLAVPRSVAIRNLCQLAWDLSASVNSCAVSNGIKVAVQRLIATLTAISDLPGVKLGGIDWTAGVSFLGATPVSVPVESRSVSSLTASEIAEVIDGVSRELRALFPITMTASDLRQLNPNTG